MQKSKVLMIEDNPDTLKFLSHILAAEFEVFTAENAVTGIEIARNQQPDLILMDVMLPHLNGLDACQLLRKDPKTSSIPIIIVSAKNRSADITTGLDIGADDYISKPFDAKELIARVKARLRISEKQRLQSDQISVGELSIDVTNRIVKFAGKQVELTLTEFDIIRCLAQSAGEVVSRKKIIEFVWSRSKKEINDRTIDVHIRSIRKKIPEIGTHLTSVYGVGYRFNR